MTVLFVTSTPLQGRRVFHGRSAGPKSPRRGDNPAFQFRMLLGIPRVFGRGSREKTTETQQVVVEVPATNEKVGLMEGGKGMVEWAKGHQLQVVLLGFVAWNVVKRVGGMMKRNKGRGAAAVSGGGGVGGNLEGKKIGEISSTKLRAVPRRHETTEEAMDLLGNRSRKYVMVGGKGGVGKTSMSAAVATAFADRGQATLIVSTDPAHSLSDAFGQPVGGGEPVPVFGVDNLYAQEVDPDSMKKTFRMMGGGAGGLDQLGLEELGELFESIPPGFDEAVALVEIVKYIQGDPEYRRFERIVFDTAPTGHTLRLLALPDFLNGFFGKMIRMKSKLGGVMNQFKGMFGGAGEEDLDRGVEDMEELKRSMEMVRELFRDEYQTEFIVATIPNMMAISESKRLVEELRKEKIPVRHLFVNQIQPGNDDCTFCGARFREHKSNLKYIEQEFGQLQISTVQSFDREIQGSGALRAMAAQLFPKWSSGDGAEKASGSSTPRSSVSVGNGGPSERGPVEPPKAQVELVD
eukprot:GFKZ01014726.1.p1 GENE.GFKZ01014726.1~~GFKZ01014726.1.p1  ORF type:complete len:520 (-),score=96.62 GFKZ01014726.1:154-1713(-)